MHLHEYEVRLPTGQIKRVKSFTPVNAVARVSMQHRHSTLGTDKNGFTVIQARSGDGETVSMYGVRSL